MSRTFHRSEIATSKYNGSYSALQERSEAPKHENTM